MNEESKSDIIWSCYEKDSDGFHHCRLKDVKGNACSMKYAPKTASTNPGTHITSKHAHCRSIVDRLAAADSANKSKKRQRQADTMVELPSEVVKINAQRYQSRMTDHMITDSSSLRKELNEAIALLVSVHSLPMSLVDSPYFKTVLDLYHKSVKAKAITQLDSKKRITASETELVESIKQIVDLTLKSSAYPLTLAFDGWQNTNHLHVQNITALSSSATVFLKSDLSKEPATAVNLFAFIEPVIDELIEKKIEVSAIVADNASVNGKIARLVRKKYPWILTLPCAAHTLQLCIVRLFEQDSLAEEIKCVVREIVKAISHSNVRLTEFLRVQGDDPVNLAKPQKTRWSSYQLACALVLKLRAFVELALRKMAKLPEHPILAKLTPSFWTNLADLVKFLEPFSYASKVIQSDQASLLDVHMQFTRLYKHCETAPVSLTHAASIMKQSIHHHWRANVHQHGTYMVAQLANEPTESSLFDDDVKVEAADWFAGWAANLWLHHESLKDATMLDCTEAERTAQCVALKAKILNQYTSFKLGHFPFSRVKAQLDSNRPAEDRHTSKFVPFDAFSPWLNLNDVEAGKELIHAAITLLSMNCSEASVERSFSQQKLTHSLLMNRKLPSTVERQMYIKSNHRVQRPRGKSANSTRMTMRSSMPDSDADDEADSDHENDYDSDTDIELFDSDSDSSDDNEDENQAEQNSNQPIIAAAASRRIRPQSQLAPAIRTWSLVPHLTPALDMFCRAYIATNQLALPTPFAQRGASKLRNAMEADPTMGLEQPSDAQRHIFFLLEEAAAANDSDSEMQDA